MKAAKLKVPKMKYVFHAMVLSPGGTAKASAVLNAQFDDYKSQDKNGTPSDITALTVANDTAFPRTLREYCQGMVERQNLYQKLFIKLTNSAG